VAAAATPAVLKLTSPDSLEQNLQRSQDANIAPNIKRGEAGSNNLSLERVNFSTRSELVTNLPLRLRDVLLRPYPWQVENTRQRFGALGTLIALAALYLLFGYIRRNRGRIVAVAAPILYPALFLLFAYALSVGNAGTGFRYRTHLVLLGLATLVILREHTIQDEPATSNEESGEVAERAQAVVGRVRRDQRALSHRGSRLDWAHDFEQGTGQAVVNSASTTGRRSQ